MYKNDKPFSDFLASNSLTILNTLFVQRYSKTFLSHDRTKKSAIDHVLCNLKRASGKIEVVNNYQRDIEDE